MLPAQTAADVFPLEQLLREALTAAEVSDEESLSTDDMLAILKASGYDVDKSEVAAALREARRFLSTSVDNASKERGRPTKRADRSLEEKLKRAHEEAARLDALRSRREEKILKTIARRADEERGVRKREIESTNHDDQEAGQPTDGVSLAGPFVKRAVFTEENFREDENEELARQNRLLQEEVESLRIALDHAIRTNERKTDSVRYRLEENGSRTAEANSVEHEQQTAASRSESGLLEKGTRVSLSENSDDERRGSTVAEESRRGGTRVSFVDLAETDAKRKDRGEAAEPRLSSTSESDEERPSRLSVVGLLSATTAKATSYVPGTEENPATAVEERPKLPDHCTDILEGHGDIVQCLCVSHSKERLFSGSHDQTIRVWDANTHKCLQTLEGHEGGVLSLSFSGHRLLSGAVDKDIRVWDLGRAGEASQLLVGHNSHVHAIITFSTNVAISASSDRTIKIWDLRGKRWVSSLDSHRRGRWGIAVNAAQQLLSASSTTLLSWDLRMIGADTFGHESKNAFLLNEGQSSNAGGVGGHAVRGDLLFANTVSPSIRCWDSTRGSAIGDTIGHEAIVNSLVLSRDYLISSSDDGTVRIWDTFDTSGDGGPSTSAPSRKDRRRVEFQRQRGTCMKCLSVLRGHNGYVYDAKPFRSKVFSAGYDATIRVWQ